VKTLRICLAGDLLMKGGWLTDFHADVKALGDEGQTITSLF